MRKRIGIVLVSAAIAAFGLIGVAAPAQASCESIEDVQCIVYQDACRLGKPVPQLLGC